MLIIENLLANIFSANADCVCSRNVSQENFEKLELSLRLRR